MTQQIELCGIGQQKAKLSDWKQKNEIYTHHAPHMSDEMQWTCWDEHKDPGDFLSEYGDVMGFGRTEKEAIIDFCTTHEIEMPFWWK